MDLDPARVKALNQQIRHLAELLHGAKDDDHEYGFSCECGCGTVVALSVPEFDRDGGAWADGHKAEERQAS
ncbi:MAG TPA: hypothetical protein VJ838_12245 [Gaiellaceae bacterium]|nr:hypothetical protein [Gaiellaceae bacterium]